VREKGTVFPGVNVKLNSGIQNSLVEKWRGGIVGRSGREAKMRLVAVKKQKKDPKLAFILEQTGKSKKKICLLETPAREIMNRQQWGDKKKKIN